MVRKPIRKRFHQAQCSIKESPKALEEPVNKSTRTHTVVVVAGQVVLINKQIVVSIQFPEFAVNHVEMFVTEVGHYLVNIFLLFQQLQYLQNVRFEDHIDIKQMQSTNLQKIRSPQFGQCNASRPAPIDCVEYPGNNCVDVSRVKLGSFFQESQSRVSVNDILNQCDQILRQNVRSRPLAA